MSYVHNVHKSFIIVTVHKKRHNKPLNSHASVVDMNQYIAVFRVNAKAAFVSDTCSHKAQNKT